MGFDGEFTAIMGSDHREYHGNKALGNAWPFPSATWLLLLLMLSTIPSSISSPPSQFNIDKVVQLWHHHHVPFGPSPREQDRQYMPQFDWLSHPVWAQRLETSCTLKPLDLILAWCIEFQHYFHPVGEFRNGRIHELRTLVDDMAGDTQQWFDQRSINFRSIVRMVYQREHGVTQIPVLLQLLKMIGYPQINIQIDILRRELSSGFPFLCKLTTGVNWYIRTDDKYTSPSSIDELHRHNHEYVLKKRIHVG